VFYGEGKLTEHADGDGFSGEGPSIMAVSRWKYKKTNGLHRNGNGSTKVVS